MQQETLSASERAPACSGPTTRVGWGFVLVFALAYAGTWLALLTPILVSIALKIHSLTPQNEARNLSLVLAVGALFALIGNPLFGKLSDRTTSRYGMRRPWLLGGALCGSAALLVIASADSVLVVLIGWCLAQLGFNAVLAAIVALLPDQVPPSQRGAVSGILGVCMPIGQLSGTFLVDAVSDSMLLMFMVPTGIGLALIALLTLVLRDRDRTQPPMSAPPIGFSEFARSYWISPRAYPDFAWAWLSRFLLVLGTAFLNTYQPLYLTSKLGFGDHQITELIFRAMLVQASMIVLASVVSGRFSDVVQRRKAFVVAGASIYASGLWAAAAADTHNVFLIGMALTGIGHGVYFAVDLALVTEVLPDRERHAAKDLGILNIANALPQSVAPLLGWLILTLGGGYTTLFIAAGCLALLGSVAILPLKSVR